MLVINYNGNKPQCDRFRFSVNGDNNSQTIKFVIKKQQGDIDLSSSSFACFFVCSTQDNLFVDKAEISTENIEIEDNYIVVKYKLLAKHTQHKMIDIGLSFETDQQEIVWKTASATLSIQNGILADEEIENQYPTLIGQILDKIKNYHDPKDKNFISAYLQLFNDEQEGAIEVKEDCYVMLTENTKKSSKQVISKYIDKKQGNRKTEQYIGKGKKDLFDLLQEIFGMVFTKNTLQNANLLKNEVPDYTTFKFNPKSRYHRHPNEEELTVYSGNKQEFLNSDIARISHKIKNASRSGKSKCVIKLQFKFVKDYEDYGIKGWNGTMSNFYLEVIVYLLALSDYVFLIPRYKRF